MAGAATTVDGITFHGDYAYAAPASFYAENAAPSGAGVVVPPGLVADPAHDNRAAIQAAIDAAASAGGGIVYIPPGVYGVGPDPEGTGGIEIRNNVFIKGAGMGETVLRVLDNAGDKVTGIIRSPHGEETNNYGISDLTLDGNRANNDPELKVDGFFSGGTPGETITDHDVTLLRVEVRNCSGYGFDPHERTERLLIDSCVAHHNGKDGFVADYIVDGEYRNNVAYANDRHGFNLTTTTNDFLLENNQAYGNAGTGAVVQRGSFDIPVPHNIVIRGNTFTDNGREGVLVQMGENILIENNTITGSGRAGAAIYGGSNVTLRGNGILASSQIQHDGYPDVLIRDYDDSLGPSGLIFAADSNLIEGNRLISSGAARTSYGVEERPGLGGNHVVAGNIAAGQNRGVFKVVTVTTELRYTGTSAAERIEGHGGDNTFHGGAGDDILKGHGGNDRLNGGAGADQLSGGPGDDVYYVDDAADSITEYAGEGYDTVYSLVSYRLKDGLEALKLYGGGAIDGKGNAGDNRLYGNDAANLLQGEAGDDSINGGGGADTLKGGDGNDTLVGGPGADVMQGGLGDDRFYVDDIGDSVSEAAGAGYDRVYASVTYTLKSNVEALTLTGAAAIDGKGNAEANTIKGNDADNALSGDAGDDSLWGGGGADTLKGGDGDDRLIGGTGADIMAGGRGNDSYWIDNALDDISERPGEGYDRVYSSISLALELEFEALYLRGGAYSGKGNALDNAIAGNDGANFLRGMEGADTLAGGGGADILEGGAGADTLTGGGGGDVFDYAQAADMNGDVILDFNRAEGDRIDLASIDARLAAGHQNFYFISDYGFFGVGGELRFQATALGSIVQIDINGDRIADGTIDVRGVYALTAADFIL